MSSSLLELSHVTKRYGPADARTSIRVLDDVSLIVADGESLSVVGPSGCGKSTLLNLMGGLDDPTSGSVFLRDRKISGLPEESLAAIRNREIGFVFQQHHLLPQCSVLENVLVPTLAGHEPSSERRRRRERAESLLERVGLRDRRDHRPAQLSGGEAQRTAVVRALINEPMVLLADEPTGSLDDASAESLSDLLLELNRTEGTALIVVTHSRPLAERMQRSYALKAGVLSAERPVLGEGERPLEPPQTNSKRPPAADPPAE